MDQQQELREQLLSYLQGRHAHALLQDAVKNFPPELINSKPANVPYTFWSLLEHIRISQEDIIDFALHPNYKYKSWPKDYWPASNKRADKKAWNKTVGDIKKDFQMLIKLVKNPKTDLLSKIAHDQGQTIFREAIMVIDHNGYHLGEFILMRRNLGVWK